MSVVYQISPNDRLATDQIEQTEYHLKNQEFFDVVFGNKAKDSSPACVSFAGNPSSAKKASWSGNKWTGEALEETNNNYFSLSTFKTDNEEFRRKSDRFVSLQALVLDDVGSKIDPDLVSLQPSWILRTSADNFQYGYIFDKPLTDLNRANKLFKDVIKAGLSDPGMSGPSTRLARLPNGTNGKYTPILKCSLRSWMPALKYSLEDLYKGLNLTNVGVIAPNDEIWVPRSNTNPVIEALKDRKLYKSKINEDKHDITCPWVHEHTKEIDGGTAYFEPSSDFPSGGFKCLHGHCAERRVKDLLEYLRVDEADAAMKAIIRVQPGEIHRIVDFAEKELSASGRYYQQNGQIVSVITDPTLCETKVKIATPNELTKSLSEMVVWELFDKRMKGYKKIDPPPRPINVLAEGPAFKYLPVLRGLSKQPYFRTDGTLVSNGGYDRESGIYGDFVGDRYKISDSPSREDALKAVEELKCLLNEFSFRDQADQAAALSAILTAAVRPVLNNAPMFHVRAHMIGSGKSYLCRIISSFATPQPNTPLSFPAKEDECNKLLLAELLTNTLVIEFDNLTSDLLPHKSLCTALTTEFIKSRILGISKTASVSTRALFLSSGNNVGPVRDMTRRCVTINIAPEFEIPAARSFNRPDLIEEILKDREKYVSHALTIIRAWITAGKPITKSKVITGFAKWSNLCVQPLLWLGCDDPVQGVISAMMEDPDRECLELFMDLWGIRFGDRPVMVKDLVTRAIGEYGYSNADEELKDMLMEIAGEAGNINRRRLGKWIARHVGQIVGGEKLVKAEGSRSSQAWQLKAIKSVKSVKSDQSLSEMKIHDGTF